MTHFLPMRYRWKVCLDVWSWQQENGEQGFRIAPDEDLIALQTLTADFQLFIYPARKLQRLMHSCRWKSDPCADRTWGSYGGWICRLMLALALSMGISSAGLPGFAYSSTEDASSPSEQCDIEDVAPAGMHVRTSDGLRRTPTMLGRFCALRRAGSSQGAFVADVVKRVSAAPIPLRC